MNSERFEKIRKFAEDNWGLTLYKADPNSRGYWNSAWKTGYILTGLFPGNGHSHRRFSTLKEIEKILQMNKS